jgi:HEAT repeat protein
MLFSPARPDSPSFHRFLINTSHKPHQDSSAEIARFARQLSSPDEEERLDAVISLTSLGTPPAAQSLRPALDDQSERVRAAAVRGLAALKDSASSQAIIARLREDRSLAVRKEAALALGELRQGQSALTDALRDRNAEVRGAAATALALCDFPSAIDPLIRALRDKSAFVRSQSSRALGALGSVASRALPSLIRVLSSDKDSEARRQSALAMGRIGDASALPALRLASQSADPYLKEAAIAAIESIEAHR